MFTPAGLKSVAVNFYDARILIVDDHKSNIDLLTVVLEGAGYRQVFSTQQPKRVCELQAEHDYQLILLDLEMPEMSGFEVLQGLIAQMGEQYIPVIALSAQPDYRQKALCAGAKDFITKPYDILELKARLKNVLEVSLLREKFCLYQRLTAMAAELCWEWDVHGRFSWLYGQELYENLQVTLQHNAVSLPENAVPLEINSLFAGLEAHAAVSDLPFNWVHNDGEVECYSLSGAPIFDHQQRFKGFRGVGIKACNP